MFIIDTKNFTDAATKSVDVCDNTQIVCATDNYVFIQGYGADWTNTPLWVYDIKSGKPEDTGEYATYVIEGENDNKAFAVFSKTDWSTYEGSIMDYMGIPTKVSKGSDTAFSVI